MPKVYSLRNPAPLEALGGVYVWRGSPWGNPFVMTHEGGQEIGSREWACAEFAKYAEGRIQREPNWLKPLVGRDLTCWCAPKQCHADTLLRLANRDEAEGSEGQS